MFIADNLRRVQERIARAAERAGRSADEITLVGVTKYVGTDDAIQLAAAGCRDLGESRPQALWRKADDFNSLIGTSSTIRWHLIGHLQRNKIARTLPLVSLIHSVDSERLLAAIDEARAADTTNKQSVPVLLEVNTSGDAAKDGLPPDEVEPLLVKAMSYPRVSIRGLMTMAALEGGETVAARNFASLRNLRDQLKLNAPPCVALNELSMGMSDDFEVAIREGATIVRVGSLLWTENDQPTSYNENREFNAYIARNMWSHLTRPESLTLIFAKKQLKFPPSSPQLRWALEEAPPDIKEASKLGYDALLSIIRKRFEAAVYPIARCPVCNCILRTPQAKLCIWCGHDWHDKEKS